MKIFYVMVAILFAGFALPAQTNSATNAAPRVTHIDSDSADFDLNARTAIYRGNVHVSDPEMKLTCDWLAADLPQAGHVNRIVARTNVVIDLIQTNSTTHATGEKAVYDYVVENGATNETVTLTGNPQVQMMQGNTIFTNTAGTIVWDRVKNRFHFYNFSGGTQLLESAPTNQFPKTNLPGTIDNVDKVLPQTQNAP